MTEREAMTRTSTEIAFAVAASLAIMAFFSPPFLKSESQRQVQASQHFA